MPNVTYNEDIPAANNNPSSDQPDMLVNTNAVQTILAVDHFGFNNNDGGTHQQVTMPRIGAIPGTTAASTGVFYTKLANGESQLFFTPDTTTNEYQLTRSTTANFGTFASNSAYAANHTGGWTFLPGGLLLQYGLRTSPGSSGTVTFPRSFSAAPFSVIVTNYRGSSRSSSVSSAVPPSATSFNYFLETSGSTGIFWYAIGL